MWATRSGSVSSRAWRIRVAMRPGSRQPCPKVSSGSKLQLLKTLVPQASRIAVLVNPTNPVHPPELPKLPEIGRLLGVELFVVEASKPNQFEMAFETAHTQGAEAIHVLGDPLVFIHSAKVVGLAARYRLPAMYFNPRFVQDGGLISYGPNRDPVICRSSSRPGST
jgi:putative ABC transport system substrate-binding protein